MQNPAVHSLCVVMIANILQKLVPGALLYIRIKHDWLSVRDVKTGHCYEDLPLAAVTERGSGQMSAVGYEAHDKAAEENGWMLKNGFEDPVSVISDARVAEMTLHYFMESVIRKGLLQPPIKAILHPTEIGMGKLDETDALSLQELALRAGAAEAYVWVGIEPMHREIIDGDFPVRGKWMTDPPGWVKDHPPRAEP